MTTQGFTEAELADLSRRTGHPLRCEGCRRPVTEDLDNPGLPLPHPCHPLPDYWLHGQEVVR